jgi:predicted ATP-dependent endonuclease of OLD family
MAASYIKRIEVRGLWGKHDLVWDNLHSDVNILVGINGSGKSSLLNIVNAVLLRDKKSISKAAILYASVNGGTYNEEYVNGSFLGVGYSGEEIVDYSFLTTFDVPVNKKSLKQDESPLMLELRNLILQTGSNSFNDYRLRATLSPEKALEINKKISNLFSAINHLFTNTHKTIEIDSTNNIVFRSGEDVIQLEQLSSGEKQLLIILFKVFLMDEKPNILLMDEPEISLHISWQQELIKTIRHLNPNCQLIIATHSPSIFGKGWGDRITFMEQLFQK